MEAINVAVSSDNRQFVACSYAVGIHGGNSWYIGELVGSVVVLRFSTGSGEGGKDIADQWLEDPDACAAHATHKIERRAVLNGTAGRIAAKAKPAGKAKRRRSRISEEPVGVGEEAAREISRK